MMNWKKKCGKQKLNDRGSAIVMVIVAVAFISILATTLLYLAGTNYYRKATDLKTKESFYEGETALEEIRAALTVEAAEAAKAAYTKVSINYAAADSATRYSLFQTEFLKVLEENWIKKTENPYDAANPYTYEYVVKSLVSNAGGINYQEAISLDASIINAGSMEVHTGEGYAILRGIVLQYTDAQGYTTKISTDYLIEAPSVNWSVEQGITGAGTGTSAERNTVDMADSVTYINYTKK